MSLKKSFGQHFLHDTNVISRIIAAADIHEHDVVIEVGPGGGALTKELAQKVCAKLVLIEADRDLIANLEETYAGAALINADAALVDYDKIVGDRPWVFVSNLPYNAGNAIIEKVLSSHHLPRKMIVMVQKEVGERIMAKPGNMSVLSVAVQMYAEISRVCGVGSGAFTPPPKVDSVVLDLVPRPLAPGEYNECEQVIALAKIGFAHRRKQLRSTLIQAGVGSSEQIDQAIASLSRPLTVRPQELSVHDWIALFRRLNASTL